MAVSVLPFRFPGIDNVVCLFQMRSSSMDASELSGGTIAFSPEISPARVVRHRRELLQAAGVSSFAEVCQVHGDDIVFEPEESALEEGPRSRADGLATSRANLALMIKTADCQPVLLAHSSGRHVAALHVGWRGDRLLFPYTGVRRFCDRYGLRPADCFAVRGPSLGPARAEFIHFAAEWGGYFRKYLNLTTSTMDLWSMTRDQLQEAGIPLRHIFSLDICTASNPQFFSYRRNPVCGRQASLIWRTE